ncbi:MAG: TonB-dependent receptor [Burkholderiaceae bacterium]
MRATFLLQCFGLAAAALGAAAALAQSPPAAPANAAATSPAGAASAPAEAAAATQRIDVTANRADDTDLRRRATAAKIVIGRDEIERYGDSSTSEILKRLPGVTVPGPPGRGGAPRMRGMAGGYTQLLLDGERAPPGFSIDSIAPEQIERIEILRAPTAETGARAIAGSINIVMREGFRKRLNDLRLAVGLEDGALSPSLSWTRNQALGDWIGNGSFTLSRRRQDNASRSTALREDTQSGATLLQRESRFESHDQRDSLHATGRLQWRNEAGSSAVLQPLLIHSEGGGHQRTSREDVIADPADPLAYSSSSGQSASRFTLLRLSGQWTQRWGADTRVEARFGLGDGHGRSRLERVEFDSAGLALRRVDERSDNRDRNASLGLKVSSSLEGGHSLVSGLEVEANRRREARTVLWDGVPQLTEFGENLSASAQRQALYVQDEWSLSPQWSAHAGLRVEGIVTTGEGANGSSVRNRSQVATPLLHAVWRPDAARRDQLRASLTRSYRSPNLNQLIGRPSLNRSDPPSGSNTALSADSAGNPALRPEVALGLDLAVERYGAEGAVLSANLFHRRIRDLIRNVVALESVSWSPGQPRYVGRPQNIGDARSSGLELEAKFRLNDVFEEAPRIDIRSNLSLFRSQVRAIPGPHNRLAEQPGGTLNLGIDHRLRGMPLTVGGNLNHTPGYEIRLDADRWAVQPDKTVVDAYALWVVSPELQWRLSVGNALAQDPVTQTRVESALLRDRVSTTTRSSASWQLRLEMKL